MGRGIIMAKFISDEDMAKLEASEPSKPKSFLSDDDMAQLEASQPSELESGLTGAFSGATAGFMDEISGATEAALNAIGVRNTHDLSKMELGVPSLDISENYRRGRDAKREMQKASQQANPNSYLAGQFGGAAASSFIPGMGGASIGKLAAQGAAQGLGDSEADLLEGDILGAARDTAIGGTIGAGMGVAGKAISAGASKASPYVQNLINKTTAKFDDMAENYAVQATGATGRQADKFADDAGRQLLDRRLVRFGDSAENIANRTTEALEESGRGIGSALDKLDNQGVTGSVDKIVDTLEAEIKELAKTPGNEQLIKQLTKEVDNLYMRGQSDLPIGLAEQSKRNFQGQTNYFSPEVDKKASAKVADAFRNEVERSASVADPSIASQFKADKETYGLLKPIQEAAQKRASTLNQSPIAGLLDTATAGVGGSLGGPMGAIVAPTLRKQFGQRAASMAAVGFDTLADQVRTQPQRFGKFAKPLMEAAQRGGNSLAATHFILQQTQPEYRTIVSGDNTDEENE